MFEEICLVCGKHLQDDGRAYCSDDCQNSDLASPSISSSSSALSSPQLGYAQGPDVPALSSALRKSLGRDPYYLPSASNHWSLVDEDDDPYARGEYAVRADSIYDASSKSASYVYAVMPSALSYARRPSGTNNYSTVPQVHQRNSSASSPAPINRRTARGAPRSAPNYSHSSSTDEEDFSDYCRDVADDADSERDSASRSRRARNRTSLPACFSLLQIQSSAASPKEAVKISPVSSSSARTIARASPPTPKHPKSDTLSKWQFPRPPNLTQDTPRGRRRDADHSTSSRRSSVSRSRSRHVRRLESPRPVGNAQRSHLDDVEQVSDCRPRGRTSIRRDSSPPPRMLMGAEDPRVLAALRDSQRFERSQSNSKSRTRRGRVGVDELGGVGSFALAPGYGHGRSGLMDHERYAAHRVPL
ncbi:hypothetical protein CC1G_01158 [Coprinopsis cinerea okayama7|uniref:Uncharacterized protein n=1 Tax=Coprinopsis cinerea (strain Okayama-7 / 130 / ATCC MYA-4618 / FGSC 9003) TaxID=240176 RepID=A8NEQ3_COPC7|nr:hypothetical protein CC1G_01158 [Coprinopsis cinerea okayama7\|eukprot:XP_001833096.2 hypothetical protein CC1G_01158 [Coprinopsis cinerea okayama7\